MDKFITRRRKVPVDSPLVTPVRDTSNRPVVTANRNPSRILFQLDDHDQLNRQEEQHKLDVTANHGVHASEDEVEEENEDLTDKELRLLSQRFSQDIDGHSDDDNEDGCWNGELQLGRIDLSQEDTTDEDTRCEESPAKRPKAEFHKDSEDMVTLNVDNKAKIFKRNEAFRYDRKYGGKIFVIDAFLYQGVLEKKARCKVYRKLDGTFIGDFESRRIEGEYVMAQFTEVVLLRKLGKKVDRPPSTSLLYHESTKETMGVGYTIAYSFRGQYSFAMNYGKPKVLEVFAGAGGMTTAMIKKQFDVKWAVENDPSAAANLKINHPNVEVFDEDAYTFIENVKRKAPMHKAINPDHIHGSPPCQGFSAANRTGGKDDLKNNDLTLHFVDIVRHFRPHTVSMENVTGMLQGDKVHYLQRVVASLIEIEYQVRVQVLNALHYGDPQDRKRVILVAAKRGRIFPKFPTATHGTDGDYPIVTVKDALSDLEGVEPAQGTGIVTSAEEKVIHNHSLDGTELRSERDKLTARRPAMTIRRTNFVQHYSKERGLTIREFARLHSFPDEYRFYAGSYAKQRGQIGNAVPVGLGTAVSKSILESYP